MGQFSGIATLKRLNPTRHASHKGMFVSFVAWARDLYLLQQIGSRGPGAARMVSGANNGNLAPFARNVLRGPYAIPPTRAHLKVIEIGLSELFRFTNCHQAYLGEGPTPSVTTSHLATVRL